MASVGKVSHSTGATFLCGGIIDPTGVYPGPGAGVFTEDFYGNLWWCASGIATEIAPVPADAPGGAAYQYMAGVSTGVGLVLALSDTTNDGAWFCIGATQSGCSLTSHFTGYGVHDTSEGIALDKHLNIYAVMFHMSAIYMCTYASSYKTCIFYQAMSGGEPMGLAMDSSGNTWVSDLSCTGNIWHNGAVMTSSPNFGLAPAIAISSANPTKTPHVYLGATYKCTSGNAGIYDVTDGHALPTPITWSDVIYGITTKLQFTATYAGNIYSVKDKL